MFNTDEVTIVFAWDQVTEGHSPRSDYVEQIWLPILGPTATLLLRRCFTLAEFAQLNPVTVLVRDLADALGVGENVLFKAFERLARFRIAAPTTVPVGEPAFDEWTIEMFVHDRRPDQVTALPVSTTMWPALAADEPSIADDR